MAYVLLKLSFDEESEDLGEESSTSYIPTSVEAVESDLSEEALRHLGEAAFQSDRFTVGLANACLGALGTTKVQRVSFP